MSRTRSMNAEKLARVRKRLAEWQAAPTLAQIAREEDVSIHVLKNMAAGFEHKGRDLVDIEKLAKEPENADGSG